MRGNLHAAAGNPPQAGSIPACAGEPEYTRLTGVSNKVYPRVCGGTPSCAPAAAHARGLSPRVRGNRPAPWRRQIQRRSIPACAGEPAASIIRGAEVKVYPRVCGGTTLPRADCCAVLGLSPRVRGNRHIHHRPAAGNRSIPACAGEPLNHSRQRKVAGVYPRVCGGTQPESSPRQHRQGLSPRVRGNRTPIMPCCCHGRSIPACAGEPPGVSLWGQPGEVYPRVCGGTCWPAPLANCW